MIKSQKGIEYNNQGKYTFLKFSFNKANFLDPKNLSHLNQALKEIGNEDINGIVLSSKNEKFFSTGMDLFKTLKLLKQKKDDYKVFVKDVVSGIYQIHDCKKPVISYIDGIACGGGLEIALSSDYIIFGTNAQVGLPEKQLGFLPGAGGIPLGVQLLGQENIEKLLNSNSSTLPINQLDNKLFAKNIICLNKNELLSSWLKINENSLQKANYIFKPIQSKDKNIEAITKGESFKEQRIIESRLLLKLLSGATEKLKSFINKT